MNTEDTVVLEQYAVAQLLCFFDSKTVGTIRAAAIVAGAKTPWSVSSWLTMAAKLSAAGWTAEQIIARMKSA